MNYIVLCLLALATSSKAQSLDFNVKFLKFIKGVYNDKQFGNILVLMESPNKNPNGLSETFIRDLTTGLEIPVVISSGTESFMLKRILNENLLAIVQIDSSGILLQQLLVYLQNRRSSRIILISENQFFDEVLLQELFHFCWQNAMINVVTVFQDFPTSSIFYRFSNFSVFELEKILWTEDQEGKKDQYFPDRMRDLKGSILPVMLGGAEPGLIVSKNKQGHTMIGGYIGHVFNAFAKKHNARLNMSKMNLQLGAQQLKQLVVINKTEEISAAPVYPNIITPIEFCSYPYDYIDWCVMIPIEPSIPINKVFTFIWKWKALCITIIAVLVLSVLLHLAAHLSGENSSFLDCLINDSLRGLLGQSFIERPNASYTTKILYSLIFILGIIFVTSYDAFLQTFITSPPPEKKLKTFDDLLASELKVMGLKVEFDSLFQYEPIFKTKYFDLFVLENDHVTFVKFRDTLNTSFAYAVNSVKWTVYQSQQNQFSRPLFRLPKELCFMKNSPWAFPINENSIYKETLNFLLLKIHSSGLLEFWKQKSFYELIEIGKIKMEDLSKKTEFVALKVEDFKWIWLALGVAYVLAFLCFLGEIFVFKWKVLEQKK